MKTILIIIGVALITLSIPAEGQAQDPITSVINSGIKKIIKALDLKIQRLQNKTIWLQNAQKVLENAMAKTKLIDISDWVEKQRNLYASYFDELNRVKTVVFYYSRIREMSEKQVHLVQEYKRAYFLFKQDKHFSADEIAYMGKVYSGILGESIKNIDQVFLVINSFETQMSDAKRLEIINAVGDRIDINLNDLRIFNQQGMLLSLQRAKSQNDGEVIKKLYGLQ